MSASPPAPGDPALLETLFARMVEVRFLEEGLRAAHKAGQTRGPLHCCDGQEAVGVGATAALAPGDVVTSTHRGHAHYLGRGLSLERVLGEIFGRASGYCQGRAGHMLIADRARGMLGGNAIVGGGIPVAVGQAWALQALNTGAVALSFFGDGAAQTGVCHESMNIAALWRLPVIFLCEHNEYGLTVAASQQSAVRDIAVRAQGYAMPGVVVDGNDVLAVRSATAEAAARARAGEGPTLIEAKTYRMTGFSTSDMGGYQSREEMAAWAPRDPIERAAAALGPAFAPRRAEMEAQLRARVEAAFAAALAAPFPDAGDLLLPEYRHA